MMLVQMSQNLLSQFIANHQGEQRKMSKVLHVISLGLICFQVEGTDY